jgi:uncharacterized protein YukE
MVARLGFDGADVDGLEAMARKLDDSAAELDLLEAQIDRLLGATVWQGQRGDRFRSEWQLSHRRRMTGARALLSSMATALKAQAGDQRGASRAMATPFAGGSSPLSAFDALLGHLRESVAAVDGALLALAPIGILLGLLEKGIPPATRLPEWLKVPERQLPSPAGSAGIAGAVAVVQTALGGTTWTDKVGEAGFWDGDAMAHGLSTFAAPAPDDARSAFGEVSAVQLDEVFRIPGAVMTNTYDPGHSMTHADAASVVERTEAPWLLTRDLAENASTNALSAFKALWR